MEFSFSTKTGHEICKIEARDKLIAKGIYKKMEKSGEVKVPITSVIVTKCS